MRPETTIETKACERALFELGVPSDKLRFLGRSGASDRIFWIPGGRPFFIEFKVPGSWLEPHQELEYNRLKKLGYDVEVHDDAEEAVNAIARRLTEARKKLAAKKVSGPRR